MRLEDAHAFADKEADPLIGVTIGERFRVIDRIGVGGMGTVYAAEQLGLARKAALKILKREMAWDPDTVTRFHREAKAMSMLAHPNTVHVFDFGETEDGLLYLAMEMLEGEMVSTRIERESRLHPVDAITIAQQVLGSLHEAHEKGIVHRDLKPDNIFLATVEGSDLPIVKVLDFGIAKLVGADKPIDQLETQAGTVFGTPRYMSPEQAQGKTLDARSDLYGVGVLLYHMVTGTPPFVDDDAVVVMAKHIKERPEKPSDRIPEHTVPFKLEAAILRALEKNADRRFQGAAEFIHALENCLIEARLVTGAYTKRPPPRSLRAIRHLIVARPLAFAAMIVGAFAGVSAFVLYGPMTGPGAGQDRTQPLVLVEDVESDSERERLSLRIQSIPEGAAMLYGEQLLGLTPGTVSFERPNEERLIRLQLEGYEDREVTVRAGAAPRTVVLEVAPLPDVDQRARQPATPRGAPSRPASRPAQPATMVAMPAASAAPAQMPPASEPTPTPEPAPSMQERYERWD